MYQNLDPNQFGEQMAAHANAVLLDVRTPLENKEVCIPGSININVMDPDFMSKVKELDTNKEYFVYCRSGGRSATACQAMATQGFTKLNNLSGGISLWRGQVETALTRG